VRTAGCLETVDKLIHYANLDGRVNAFYSTPAVFTQALHDTNFTWSVKVCAVRLLLLGLGAGVCCAHFLLSLPSSVPEPLVVCNPFPHMHTPSPPPL
jgi:hypothetical protein